jgi:hypothetical protein
MLNLYPGVYPRSSLHSLASYGQVYLGFIFDGIKLGNDSIQIVGHDAMQ